MAQRVAPNWKGGYTCSQGDITRPMGNRLHSGLHHKPGRTSRAPWEINFPKEEADALTVEIQGMLEKQAISRVPREQEAKGFIPAFPCSKKGGGKRPTINFEGLNTFVEKEHFKMERTHIKDILKPGDWMTKVDLKDAYIMISLATSQKQLVQFQWQREKYHLKMVIATFRILVKTRGAEVRPNGRQLN